MPTLTPPDTDFVDSAPIRITTTVNVNATAEEVWAVLADNERFIAWDPPHRWAFTILDANFPGIISVVENQVTRLREEAA